LPVRFFYDGSVNENVFAYSNRAGDERALILYNNSYYQTSGWIKDGAVAIPQKDGSKRRDSLCSALSLHGESDYFAILREQRSGLWFVRSSKDIAERGLFAALSGYEAQVFIDVREVRDDYEGTWARLHHNLGGKGVPDLSVARMDIVLDELYYRYSELFKPELWAFGMGTAELKPLVLNFVQAVRKFLDGAGVYAPWTRPDATDKSGRKTAAKATGFVGAESAAQSGNGAGIILPAPEKVWEDFSLYLERINPIPKEFSDQQGKSKKTSGEKTGDVSQENPSANHFAIFAYGYATLAVLKSIIAGNGPDAVSLVNHWQLDRKLREILNGFGIDGSITWNVVEIMKTVLTRTGTSVEEPVSKEKAEPAAKEKMTAKKSARDIAQTIMLENYSAADFRNILGINVFDDVTWYNKEAFDRVLLFAPVFAALENGDFALVKNIAAEFRKAEAKAGYKLGALIEGLNP